VDAVETEGRNRRLTNIAALTVVLFSVLVAVEKIKDDNIVQGMQQAKSDTVDTWAEYQAARLKLHQEESRRDLVAMIQTIPGANREEAAKQTADAEADIKKYTERSQSLMNKAKGLEARYDELGLQDDQFDTADAFLSIAIAVAAVAILVENWWLVAVSWLFGGVGAFIGIAGFLGIPVRIEWLIQLLT
jgi:hypothetical protein